MTPLLDLDGEPWVAALPSLGHVFVHADGCVTVRTDPGTDGAAAEVLTANWGEPLGWLRRGRMLLRASTLVDPATGLALAVAARSRPEQELVLLLAARGWLVLADAFTPIRAVDGQVVADSRAADVVVHRHFAERHRVPVLRPARPGGSGVTVDVARAAEATRLAMVIGVVRRQPDGTGTVVGVERGVGADRVDGIEPVEGLDRVRWAQSACLELSRTVHDPRTVFEVTTALARLSIGRLALNEADDAAASMCADRLIDGWNALGEMT